MDEYLTLKDVASLLRVSYRTVVRWIRAGYIHPVRIGGTMRFKRTTLLWQIEQMQSAAPSQDESMMG